MNKLLLFALALTSTVQAQDIRTASRVYNFSGHEYGGYTGINVSYSSPGYQILYYLDNDRNGNPNSAIKLHQENHAVMLRQALGGLNATQPYTISFWFKKMGAGTTGLNGTGSWAVRPFFVIPNTSSGSYGEGTFIGFNTSGNKLRIGHANSASNQIKQAEFNFPTNYNPEEWNYYMLKRTANNELVLYINNELVQTVTGVPFQSSFNGENGIRLGGNGVPGHTGYCKGYFDNIRVYQGDLSDVARNNLFAYENNDSYRPYGVNSWYSLDTNPITDSSNQFTGVITGSYETVENRLGQTGKATRFIQPGGSSTNTSGMRIPYLNEYLKSKGTISLWIKPTGTHRYNSNGEVNLVTFSNGALFNNSSKGGSLVIGLRRIEDEVKPFVRVAASELNESFVVETILNEEAMDMEAWHYLTVTHDELGEIKFYQNGQLVGNLQMGDLGTFPKVKTGGGMDVLIAHSDAVTCGESSGYDGVIDDLSISEWIVNAEYVQDTWYEYQSSLSNADVQVTTFQVYPNPVKDILYHTPSDVVRIYDLTGRLVLATTSADQVDLTGLQAGTYVLQLQIGEATHTQKISKQ